MWQVPRRLLRVIALALATEIEVGMTVAEIRAPHGGDRRAEAFCQSITAVDVFCGIGGLTRGLRDAGITVGAGVDNDSTCRYA